MSVWSDFWNRFLRRPTLPKVTRWNRAVTVWEPTPASGVTPVVTFTLDDATVVKGVHNGGPESGQYLLSLSDPPNHQNWGGELKVEAPGFRTKTFRVNAGNPSGQPDHEPDWPGDVSLQKAVTIVQIVMRDPLPPFPSGSFDRVFPKLPPGPDLLTYRGNFCGIRVPGLTAVPEGPNYTTTGKSDLCMAMHLDRLPEKEQHQYLETYASCGYTHFQQSLAHSRGFGRSIKQYVETSKLIQSYGLWADHWLMGGPGDPRDADASYWGPALQPYMDALKGEGAIDSCCIGWQLDGYNEPGAKIMSIFDYVASELVPFGIPIGTHWMNEAGAWWKTNDTEGRPRNRFEWWQWCRGKISWFHHQGNTDMSIPEYQAKLVDTLQPFGDGRMGNSGLFGDRPFGLTIFECSAQDQFDGKTTEAEGDLRSYLLMCTKAASMPVGYGNGCRGLRGEAI